MALADPQQVTINGVVQTLPRIKSGPPESLFALANGDVQMAVRVSADRNRFRRNVKLTQFKVAANPITTVNSKQLCVVNFTVDFPQSGEFSLTEVDYLTDAMCLYLGAASTNAPKIWGGES